ncbi:MAG: phosphatidate cytidylyltransferase, partial [Defluviitaleaceae bacterium]|nr:phosphatidate cytidylyltransferase [Defluviitaleaceae bacterium]
GMSEMYSATLNGRGKGLKLIAYLFAAGYYILIPWFWTNFFLAFVTVFIVAMLTALVISHKNTAFEDCASVILGFFHIAFLLSFIYMTRQYFYGAYAVWLIFIAAWGCDTFAFFAGKCFGKRKLAPELSPNKTVEGAIGGVIGAAALAAAYGLAVSRLFTLSESELHIVLLCTIVGAVGAVFAQFGDLAASAVKRAAGKKDYGKLLPGHGGVIDRFDSVLFTAPVVYMVMYMIFEFYRRWGSI